MAGASSFRRPRPGGSQRSCLSALKAERARSKRLAEITAHLDTLDDDELDLCLR